MRNKKISISDSELEVLRELWENTSLTARQLTDKVTARTEWSDPTVKTLLLRLLQKNAVERKREGKVFVYRALVDKEEYRFLAGKTLLDRFFNGITGDFLTCLVKNNSISHKEIEELKKLLDDAGKK